MATPVGHALAGYAVYCMTVRDCSGERRRLLLGCLGLAIAPDLDFLPGLLQGQPALYHQGISHSLGFALVASSVIMGFYRAGQGATLGMWRLFFLSYVSHLVIDLFGPDGRLPYGIPLFWPFNDTCYLAPWQVFWGVHHVGSTSMATGDWLRAIFHPYNLGAIGIEGLVTVPLVLLAQWRASRRCQVRRS